MRRTLLLVMVMVCTWTLAIAQKVEVTGKVTDKNGAPFREQPFQKKGQETLQWPMAMARSKFQWRKMPNW